jgi:hypothetical protein
MLNAELQSFEHVYSCAIIDLRGRTVLLGAEGTDTWVFSMALKNAMEFL